MLIMSQPVSFKDKHYIRIWGIFYDIFENIRALAFTSENLI